MLLLVTSATNVSRSMVAVIGSPVSLGAALTTMFSTSGTYPTCTRFPRILLSQADPSWMEASPPEDLRTHSPTVFWLAALVRLSAVSAWLTCTFPVASGPSPLTVRTRFSTASLMVSVPPLSILIVSPAFDCSAMMLAAMFSLTESIVLIFCAMVCAPEAEDIGMFVAFFPDCSLIAAATLWAPAALLIGICVAFFASIASIFALTFVVSLELISIWLASTMMCPWLSAPCPFTVMSTTALASAFRASASPTAFASAASPETLSVSSIGTVITSASDTTSSTTSFRFSLIFLPSC